MSAIAIGVGATLLLDAWHLLLRRGFGVASMNYCLLGRWALYMPEGRFRHADIRTTVVRRGECAVGWIAHYIIGISLGVGFLLVTPEGWLARPTLSPAILFGVATVVLPLFILQPAFGLGVAASRTPFPWQARLKSLATHLVFGLGLYLCALALNGAYSL